MNYKLVLRILGRIMLLEAAAMLPSLFVSLGYHDGAAFAFIYTIAALLLFGSALAFPIPKSNVGMRPKDGFLAVALAWITLSVFGAFPMFLSGVVGNYIDALFETVSGLTTTGSTILPFVEGLPESILFWRSFTHWMGGMGVLILTLAILPAGDRGVHNLMKAESPGPSADRIVPRLRQTAMILYAIYLALSAILVILLLCGGMNLFDSFIHMFGTAGTGGFSNRNLSVGAYNSLYLEIVIGVFLIIFGINFGVYFALITRRFSQVYKNTELKVFFGIIAASTLMIALNLMIEGGYTAFGLAVRHSFFQTSSIISTAGFGTADFTLWPDFSKSILIILMITGASASSTGGGIKIIRVVILFKSAVREIKKILHPRSVNLVLVNGKSVSDETITGVMHFFFVYLVVIITGTLIVSLDNYGLVTAFSAVLSSVSNIGPGFEHIGPMSNYSAFSDYSKGVLTLCMLIGRLEIFPILMLFIPSVWKRN